MTLIVSGNTFHALQIKPYAGRLLNFNDDLRGIPYGANCVLSYRLWQSQFHSDLSAIGKHIIIGAVQFTIIGVTPPEFFGLSVGSYHDLILPISAYAATNPAMRALDDRGWTWLHLIARSLQARRFSNGQRGSIQSIRRFRANPHFLQGRQPNRTGFI